MDICRPVTSYPRRQELDPPARRPLSRRQLLCSHRLRPAAAPPGRPLPSTPANRADALPPRSGRPVVAGEPATGLCRTRCSIPRRWQCACGQPAHTPARWARESRAACRLKCAPQPKIVRSPEPWQNPTRSYEEARSFETSTEGRRGGVLRRRGVRAGPQHQLGAIVVWSSTQTGGHGDHCVIAHAAETARRN